MVKERKVPVGYKETEVGVIPEDWEVKELGEIGQCLIGLTYKPENVKNYGLLVLRSSNIEENTLKFDDNVFVDIEVTDDLKVKENDLLICVRNGSRDLIGKCALIDKHTEGATFGAFMSVYRSSFSKYVFHCFQSDVIKKQIELNLGATINQITNKSLNSFKVAIPKNDYERNKIVTALSDIDALIVSLKKLIEKKRLIKQGTMQQLLTGKKRLDGFSGEWKKQKMSEIGRVYGGLSGKSKSDFSRGNALYIPFMNVMSNPIIDLGFLDKVYIKDSESQNVVLAGDLLFNTSSETPDELGMCSVLLEEVEELYLNSFCFGFRLNDLQTHFPLFLSYLFRSDVGRKLMYSLAQGATRYNLSKNNFMDLEIKIPEYREQLAIAQILFDMDTEIAKLEKKLDKYKAIKQGMMQELLTGKRRLV